MAERWEIVEKVLRQVEGGCIITTQSGKVVLFHVGRYVPVDEIDLQHRISLFSKGIGMYLSVNSVSRKDGEYINVYSADLQKLYDTQLTFASMTYGSTHDGWFLLKKPEQIAKLRLDCAIRRAGKKSTSEQIALYKVLTECYGAIFVSDFDGTDKCTSDWFEVNLDDYFTSVTNL